MLNFYKTINAQMTSIETIEDDCWINLVDPTTEEINIVADTLQLETSFLRAALDPEETSRIDMEEGQTLIIIDVPITDPSNTSVYSTLPLGLIVTQKHIISVCLKDLTVLNGFETGRFKGVHTSKRTRFIFLLFLQVAKQFLQCLRQIDKLYNHVERQLYKSQRSKELMQLLDLEKSLVYFNTSLKGNEVTLKRILRGKVVTIYEDDEELLEDVLIEVHQAIEMTNIYSSIISGMMDAFANIISNNLNVIMKVLTSLTILLTIPNIVFGFYGMNVAGLPFAEYSWVPLVISFFLVAIVAVILKIKNLF
jgi:magnesium transporter